MPIRACRIMHMRVETVACPKKRNITGEMVRVDTCRSCKCYCGEHGGGYVECSYEKG